MEKVCKKCIVFCPNCHKQFVTLGFARSYYCLKKLKFHLAFYSLIRNFALCMEKIRFDVVGLYHWDVRDHWKEYAAGAVGRQLVLQPQPENLKDPRNQGDL